MFSHQTLSNSYFITSRNFHQTFRFFSQILIQVQTLNFPCQTDTTELTANSTETFAIEACLLISIIHTVNKAFHSYATTNWQRHITIDQSINQYFIVDPKVAQRADQLSLPHV